jgi:hypothetical protein
MEAFYRNPYVKRVTDTLSLKPSVGLLDLTTVVTTLGVFALICYIYLALKPTVVIPPPGTVSKCPSRWIYNEGTSECEPLYSTKCNAFNPDSVSNTQKCDIVKACGTYWKGLCDY